MSSNLVDPACKVFAVQCTDIDLDIARAHVWNEYQDRSENMLEAGLHLGKPEIGWGLITYNPHLFFYRIIGLAYGDDEKLKKMFQTQEDC